MKLAAPSLKFELPDLVFVYGVPLALSLTLINPWDDPYGGI